MPNKGGGTKIVDEEIKLKRLVKDLGALDGSHISPLTSGVLSQLSMQLFYPPMTPDKYGHGSDISHESVSHEEEGEVPRQQRLEEGMASLLH